MTQHNLSSELLCLITVIVDKHLVLSLKTYSLTEYWDIVSYLALLIYNYYAKLSFDCLLTTSVCCYDRKKITLLFKPPLIRLQKTQFKLNIISECQFYLACYRKNWLRNVKLCPWKLVFKFTSVGYCVVPLSMCGNFITNIVLTY